MKNRIRECRKAAGMTQAELGERAGLVGDAIAKYELGLREPKLAKWEQLASALHVSPAYLVGWSDEKGQP
ncbi:helix-turn-helix domain-containing protein [Limosilactobacillus oris]|uniref:helix-turn-helix domain-containing protein n=1 Tax=Limosilactobacillus oris TaxID=1632 RepID=UPI0021B3BB47|nr:helix-turn-helix transcriptional regulator [Limosilactobacillus oris]UXC67867.1 helix-turn-helix domain-containing protein [Limosilactobacillus oris]